MKRYSRQEVLQHNTIDDCWIIINNNVYDITDFLAVHPGGRDILETRAGEDATSYFLVKHWDDQAVARRLANFKIGEIIESQHVTADDLKDPFLAELIDRCQKENLYEVPPIHKNPYFLIRLTNVCCFFAASFIALYAPVHWSIAIALVFIQGLIGTSLFGLVAHEATHRDYPQGTVMKKLVTWSWPIFWPFIVKNPLRFEHNSHHIKIGDPEFDYEVAAFAPFIRYSGSVRHTFFHRYQHKLARYLYPFYANIITTLGAYHSKFWNKHNRADLTEQTWSLMATLTYFIIIPTLLKGSLLWYVTLYLVYQCTLFYGIYVGAAINHFIPAIMKPIPEPYRNNYAYYVCHNTSNFCTDSTFWTWYTGGFNIQIEHHLIPFIPVDNLHKMVPIVKALCAKYGYPYHDYDRFGALWNDHYAYLRQLSEEPANDDIAQEVRNKQTYQAR